MISNSQLDTDSQLSLNGASCEVIIWINLFSLSSMVSFNRSAHQKNVSKLLCRTSLAVNSITKGARQRGLYTFFSCEFLPNENILGTLEKHESDIDNMYWFLAEEIKSGKFLKQNSPRSIYPKNREVCCTYIIAQKQSQIGQLVFFAQKYRWK